MTRVHDMGGRWGDGPVDPADPDVFAEDWHARALGLTLAAGALGRWSLDASRHAREALPPADYARFHYYEKWLAGLAALLVGAGVATRDELAGAAPAPGDGSALRPQDVEALLSTVRPYTREAQRPRFPVGTRVRTRLPARNALVPGGHTRLPAYAAGHVGRIVALRGAHVFPDANAHGLGEAPQPLYTVGFSARDLWGAAEHDGDEVMLDLWESYLEPA